MVLAQNEFRGHHFTCWRMKVFIAAAVKGPQESKAQVHSSNSNSRGKSLTFPHLNLHFHLWATIPELLLASCSEIAIPTSMLPSKPSVNTNRPLSSCCNIIKLGALMLGKIKSTNLVLMYFPSDGSMHAYHSLPF